MLWRRYHQTGDAEARGALLAQHLDLVRLLARRLSSRIGGAVEIDDLVSSGTLGLVQALESFDPERGNTFPTYASRRIHGAMLDELRRRDWVPRSVRAKARKLSGAAERLHSGLKRRPEAREVAAALGIDEPTYHSWCQAVDGATLVSMDEPLRNDGSPGILAGRIADETQADPLAAMDQEEDLETLTAALQRLSERERTVLMLYYYEEMNLREIATVLRLTESRISQIRTAALRKLRQMLGRVDRGAA